MLPGFRRSLCGKQSGQQSDITGLWEEWDRKKGVWMGDGNLRAQVVLVEATLRSLPEILRGKVPFVELLVKLATGFWVVVVPVSVM